MIIDFRVRPPFGSYLNTHMYRDRERTATASTGRGHQPPRSTWEGSWELFLQEFDAAGLNLAVVPGRRAEPAYGDVSNEDVAAMVRESGGRLLGLAAVKEGTPEAPDELEHAVRDLGLIGLALDPGYADQPCYADDPALRPLYERARRLGVFAMVTVSGNAGPDISFGDPVPLDRVAAAFPDLQIVMAHGGWPWIPQALGVAYRRRNVWILPDTYAVNMPGSQLYAEAANGFLKDRLLFGSTYPFLPLDGALRSYRELPIRPEVLEGVLGGNAQRLLEMARKGAAG